MNTIRTSILRSGALAARTVSRFTLLRSIVRGLLGLAALVLAHTALAQAWQTVDDYQYVAGQPSINGGLTVAPSGVVYASGHAGASGVSHGLVMASADGGNTWSAPLDDFVYPGSNTIENSIVSDLAGNLYVSGYYWFLTRSLNTHQFVRRSTDGGATWSIVDDLALGSNGPLLSGAGKLSADPAGNIYVVEQPGKTWEVGKGIGGTNYSTVDVFQPSSSQAYAVLAHPTAGVFAAGYGTVVVTTKKSTTTSLAWVIRRSLDGGATWTTVDSYQASSGYNASARALGADGNGNIYAVGTAAVPAKSGSVDHWQVRKSTNGGATWSTVDDYQYSNYSPGPLGFAADANGNLYVAGTSSPINYSGANHWIVRKSLGGNGTWTTVDDFTYLSLAGAYAITADHLGNVFAGGSGAPSATSGTAHWLVRKN